MKQIFLVVTLIIIANISVANQLVDAVESNSMSKLRLFLESGENPNLLNINNSTALIQATLLNNYEMVKLLLEYNADPNLYNVAKVTPLHIAARQGNIEIAKILLQYGASPNIQDFSGFTPFLRAITNQNLQLAKLLLVNKAKANISNNNHHNGFDLAIKHNMTSLISILIADFSDYNLNYLTILKEKAISDKNNEIANIIAKKINELLVIKHKKQQIFIVKKASLTGYITKNIKNFPCLNNLTEITQEVCIRFADLPFLAIKSQAKPKYILASKNVTEQQITALSDIEQAGFLSWIFEPLIAKPKISYIQLAANIRPIAKPKISYIQLVTNIRTIAKPQNKFSYEVFSTKENLQLVNSLSWKFANIAVIAKAYPKKLAKINSVPVNAKNKQALNILQNKQGNNIMLKSSNINNYLASPLPLNNITQLIPKIKPNIIANPIIIPVVAQNSHDNISDVKVQAKPQNNFLAKNIAIAKPLNANIKQNNLSSQKLSKTKHNIANLTVEDLTSYYDIVPVKPQLWRQNDKYMPINLFNKNIIQVPLLVKKKNIANKAAPQKQKNHKAKFYIQIGAYTNKANLVKTSNKAKSFAKVKILTKKYNHKIISEVLIGPFISRLSANKIRYNSKFIKELGEDNFIRILP